MSGKSIYKVSGEDPYAPVGMPYNTATGERDPFLGVVHRIGAARAAADLDRFTVNVSADGLPLLERAEQGKPSVAITNLRAVGESMLRGTGYTGPLDIF